MSRVHDRVPGALVGDVADGGIDLSDRDRSEREARRWSPLGDDDARLLAERFRLLADPGRLRIVYALLDNGELCVSDLAELVDASDSATSHQLRHLRMGGVARARKVGRSVLYRIADDHVALLLDMAADHYLGSEDLP